MKSAPTAAAGVLVAGSGAMEITVSAHRRSVSMYRPRAQMPNACREIPTVHVSSPDFGGNVSSPVTIRRRTTSSSISRRRMRARPTTSRPIATALIANCFDCKGADRQRTKRLARRHRCNGRAGCQVVRASYPRLLTPLVSQIMKSSSVCRVLSATNPTTIASSTKPRNGVLSGIRSNGSIK